jgi:O-antigen biosynthesis protein
MPEYAVRSRLPIAGRIIAWTRRHLTSHLKEPYLDPIVQRQETFNREVLDTLLPMLERTVREQRRLQHEVETLRAKLAAISADSRTETKTTGE